MRGSAGDALADLCRRDDREGENIVFCGKFFEDALVRAYEGGIAFCARFL